MATIIHQPREARSQRFPFASPHGFLYALPISLALWALIAWLVGLL